MCEVLAAGRAIGRRANVVIVAEGVRDRDGREISSGEVRRVLEERLGEDARVTILGHVQRGGSPSAFDRNMATVVGHAAVQRLLTDPPGAEPQLIGLRGHQVVASPLMDCVEATRSVADAIEAGEVDRAMSLRGGSFAESYALLRTLVRARHRNEPEDHPGLRIGILHAGGPAPGMNASVRVAVRVALAAGHRVFGIRRGFRGLIANEVEELDWMSVSGWVSEPGAELGTSRRVPRDDERRQVDWTLDRHELDGLVVIGGFAGYAAAHAFATSASERGRRPVPVMCVPATIDNDLPGSELSIGADTALNEIVDAVDRIKESAVASQRCFVVEVMGHDCGYLALLGGLATGAEQVYLPEEGITLGRLQTDLMMLRRGFALGKRRGLVIRSERSDPLYTTKFVAALFEHESSREFDVRSAVLGHVQQGGSPSPFDRILATRLASAATNRLLDRLEAGDPADEMVGQRRGEVVFSPLAEFPDLVEPDADRPAGDPWWMGLRRLAGDMAAVHPDPGGR